MLRRRGVVVLCGNGGYGLNILREIDRIKGKGDIKGKELEYKGIRKDD